MYPVFYYNGFNDHDLGDGENPLRKKINAIIENLEKNNHVNLRDVKLIHGKGGIKYFRAKLSDKDRLLFKAMKYGDKDVFVILEVILNHKYDKSKFLMNKEKIKNIEIINKNDEEVSDSASEVKIRDAPQVCLLGKFITLDAEQEEIVENAEGKYNLPLVVSGAAGSGKTSVALEKLRKIKEKFKGGKILYITKSENLIKKSKELYEYAYYDEVAKKEKIVVPEEIEFLSVHEFLKKVIKEDEKIKKRVEGKKPVNRNAFFSWFNEKCKRDKFKKYKKDGDKIFEELMAVIGGGGLLGKEGKGQYVNLGDRQSIFPKEKRDDIYSLFEEYKKFIEESSEYYDTSLIAYECVKKVQKVYDAVVVDEVQDLTESTLGLILKSLKDESKSNFLLCGDVNQVIHPSFFSLSKLKSFLCQNKYDKELKVCVLEKNYRNSKQVIELANRVLHFKNYDFASEDKMTEGEKKAFFMKSSTENPGNVGFIAKGDEQEIAEKISESTNWAVLVLNDESKEDARKLFGTPLVFSIQEAKGLEFENVILYKFTSHEAYNKIWNVACPDKDIESTIKEIRNSYDRKDVNTSRTKNKEDKSFEEYKFYMNALYVAVTRAINNVYIIGDEKKCNLLRVIEPERKSSVGIGDIKKEESSPEEWKDMALKLIDEGNIEQAKGIVEILIGLQKQEHVKDIINTLKAKGYHEVAQGISNELQSSLDKDGKGVLGQTVKLLSGLKTGTENPSSQFPQKRLMGTNKAKAKGNEEISNEKNRRRGSNERVSASKKQREQKENLPELKASEGLKKIISRDQLEKFKEKTKQKKYNKEEVLFFACGNASFKIANYLISEQGVDVNTNGDQGFFPLHFAAQNGHKDMVEFLLKKGADVNAKSPEDITPLYHAARKGHKDIVELLLGSGAINALDTKSFTPLHIAAQEGHKDVVEVIIERTGVDARNGFGDTPLRTAAQEGHENVVEFLLQKGANVNAGDEDGFTPLHVAAQNGHKDVVELLLNREADVNAGNEDGCTPLHLAAQDGHKDVADLLLADPNINVGCIKIGSISCKNKEDKEKILQKLNQDDELFNIVKQAVNEEDGGKLDKSLKKIEELLKTKNKYGFKPSLNYSPDGKDENTTIKIAIKAGGEVLQLLYDYAEKDIGVNTKIFKQLKTAKEQQENSQPKSDFSDVSAQGLLTQSGDRGKVLIS